MTRNSLEARWAVVRALVALDTVFVIGCGGGGDSAGPDGNQPPPPAPVASVRVTPDSSDISAGGTAQLVATPRAASGSELTGRLTTWATSDPSIATVATNGLVTAVLPGRAVITATAEGKSGSAVIRVRAPVDTLPGPSSSVAVSAIPQMPVVTRPGDYTADAPDLPGLPLSFNTVIVMIAPNATLAQLNALLREFEATIVGGIPGVAAQQSGMLTLRLPTKTHAEMLARLALMRTRPGVRGVVRDKLLAPMVMPAPVTAPFGWQWSDVPPDYTWALQKIRAPQMWNLNDFVAKAHRRTVTFVFDVGFATSHEDLTYQSNTTPGSVADHGTHVAGTIGATYNNGKGVDGVNPFASLIVKGDATTSTWLWAFDSLMRASSGIRVVNVSLGYNWAMVGVNTNTHLGAQFEAETDGDFVKNALLLASTFGPLPYIVCAAGNDSDDGLGLQLAKYASPFANASISKGAAPIIVVESDSLISSNGSLIKSEFSNTGGAISAPGSRILSTVPPNVYLDMSGTSQATPHVSGLIGYLLALDPTIPPPTMSNNPLLPLLRRNARLVTGAIDMIDAYLSAMDVDALQGGTNVLKGLLDIDDGTPDGNQRIDRNGQELFTLDADNDGGLGDGNIDMSDFRRWRDWVLDAERPSSLALNGQPSNLKRDGNRDGVVNDPNALEVRYSRGDFNGDGFISRTRTSLVSGAMGRRIVTDLEVFQQLFQDPNYAKSALPGLIDSVDLTAYLGACRRVQNVTAIHIEVEALDDSTDVIQQRTVHLADDSIQVLTLPIHPQGYHIKVSADRSSDTVAVESTPMDTTVGVGADIDFDADCGENFCPSPILSPRPAGSDGSTSSWARIRSKRGERSGSIAAASTPSCATFNGNILIQKQADFAQLAGISRINGFLNVVPSNVNAITSVDLKELAQLTEVTGGISIMNIAALQRLDGLRHLTTTTGTLQLANLPGLTKLTGLNLTNVTGVLRLWNLTALSDLTSLQSLTHVGELVLDNVTQISSLATLKNTTIDGLEVQRMGALVSLSGLDHLSPTMSRILVANNPVLVTMPSLRTVAAVTIDVFVTNNAALTQLDDLAGLRTVGRNMSFYGSALTSMAGLAGLQRVTGNLTVSWDDSPQLSAILFPGLTHVGAQLYIYGHDFNICPSPRTLSVQLPALTGDGTVIVQVGPALNAQPKCSITASLPSLAAFTFANVEGKSFSSVQFGASMTGKGLEIVGTSVTSISLGTVHLDQLTIASNLLLTTLGGGSGKVTGLLTIGGNPLLSTAAAVAWAQRFSPGSTNIQLNGTP